MAKGKTQSKPQARVVELQSAERTAREYAVLMRTWLSTDEKDVGVVSRIIESYRSEEGPDGMYQRVLSATKDAGVKGLLQYFVGVGAQMQIGDGDDAETFAPSQFQSYFSKLASRVGGLDADVSSLEKDLAQARAEVTRLKPYETRYNALVGDLDNSQAIGLEALMEDFKRGN